MPTATMARLLLIASIFVTACGEPAPSDAGAGDAGHHDAGLLGVAPCARDAGPATDRIASGLTNSCTQGLLVSGFGLRWDDGSHRLGDWGVHARIGAEHFPEGCVSGAELRGATLSTELNGAGESTGAGGVVSVTYHVIGADLAAAPDAGPGPFGVRIARGSAIVDLVPAYEEETRQPALFDLAAASMSDAPAVTVVLDGLELVTDLAQGPEYPTEVDPADGYPIRGVGAAIENIERDGDDLRFDVGARFALGLSDDASLNRAVANARVQVVVHYAVVGLETAPLSADLEYSQQHHPHAGEAERVCRPDPALTMLQIDGPVADSAAPALRRFELDLFDPEGQDGDLIGELSIRVLDFEHTPETGQARMRVEGYASNGGPPTPRLPMSYRVRATVELLTWSGGEAAAALRFDAPIHAGHDEAALPLTE